MKTLLSWPVTICSRFPVSQANNEVNGLMNARYVTGSNIHPHRLREKLQAVDLRTTNYKMFPTT